MNNEQNTENPMAAQFKTVQGAVTRITIKLRNQIMDKNKILAWPRNCM